MPRKPKAIRPKAKIGGSDHQRAGTDREHAADPRADAHQAGDGDAHPVGAEVSGDEAGQDVERRAAFARCRDDFLHVARFGRGEDFHQLRDDRAGQRAAGDDRGELPPHRGVAAERGDEQVGDGVRDADGEDRGDPHQRRERRLEVHDVGVLVLGRGDRAVEPVGDGRGDDHQDAHDEDPDQELRLHDRIADREQDERDQRDAGDAVGFESVGSRADRVAGVVAGAVGDDAGVAGIVFLDVEDDLHQVRSDVGDLGEDAAGDAQRRGAERFTDGEADEARSGVVARHEQQDEEHQHELGGDEQHADRHAGLERDVVRRERLAAQRRERGARVGEGVDADAEPRHAVAAGDADEAEDDDDGGPRERRNAAARRSRKS